VDVFIWSHKKSVLWLWNMTRNDSQRILKINWVCLSRIGLTQIQNEPNKNIDMKS
jgi:hypothetical protein